jgi:hypothetical protein
MPFGARRAFVLILALAALLLSACGGAASPFSLNTPPTIYDLTQRPQEFAGREVTAQGYYLWKPGDPAVSLLLPGLSTAVDSSDAQPIYASVECQPNGECKPSTTTVGEASTGSIWLDNFPAEVTADLHRPGDAVYGVVEVTGVFEANGGYGPDGSYQYRMDVRSARPLQKVERLVSSVPNEPLGEGKTTIFELSTNPAQYDGQTVTTQGYYFWTPATGGSLVESVEREKTGADDTIGIAPQQAGVIMGLDGFPAEQSGALNVGPNGTFVWGKVEVTGTFQTGAFGPDGRYPQQIVVERVTPLEQTSQ